MSWLSRVANVFRSSDVDHALDEEIAFHIESRVDELVAGGVRREAAEVMARRQFGNRLLLRESSHDVKLLPWLEDLVRDLRHGARALRRAPAFTGVAVLTLALGIGVNAAVFAVINSVLLLPLPFPHSDRLFLLRGEARNGGIAQYSYSDFVDLRSSSRSFKAMAAWRGHGITLSGSGEPEFVDARQASAGLFRVLGVTLVLGREFSAEEDRSNAEAVALISHALWQRRFSSRPDTVGARIILDGKPHTVVGVLPEGFNLFGDPSVYTPLGQYEDISVLGRRSRPGIWVVARLQDGVSLESAREELAAISRGLAEQFPDTNERWQFTAVSLRDSIVGNTDRTLFLFAAAAGLVLLIACANVANLFLARAAARAHEFTVRAALGATRRKILRQVLVESLLISIAAGIVGLIAGSLVVRLVGGSFVDRAPALANFAIDWRVCLFTLFASVLAGALFLVPEALRQEHWVEGVLTQTTRGVAPAVRRIQAGLVVAQIALAFALLVGTGLMLRTIVNLRGVEMGFDPQNVLTTGVGLSPTVMTSSARIRQAWEEILVNTAAIPGVQSAALNISLPLQGEESVQYSIGTGGTIRSARIGAPTLDYWKTMRIPLMKGRFFDDRDTAGAPMVAIIDEQLATNAFPGRDPVGESLILQVGQPVPVRIVGIVRHLRYSRVDEDATRLVNEQLYIPFAQLPNAFLRPLSRGMRLVIRTVANPGSLERPLRQAVMGTGVDQPVHNLRTMEQIIDGTLRERQLVLRILGTFGSLALVLATVGVAGVVAYLMSRRFREIGIRIALGARSREVLTLVLRQGATMVAIGVAIGILTWLGLMRMMAGWLYGVTPLDPTTLAAVAFVLGATAMAATYIPARRCLRLDPVEVLRYE